MSSVLPMFSSRSFMVSGLTFMFFIYFQFIFVLTIRKWSSFILFHVAVQFSQQHLLKRLSFPHCISCLLCHRLIDHINVGLFLGSLFYSIDACVCICASTMLVFFFFNLFILLIYFWLHWVFTVLHGLSLAVVSSGYCSLWCAGFLLQWLLLLWSTGSRHVGFSSCGSRALERRLSSCGTWTQLLRGMWDLPGPGLKPMSPALVGRFLTIVPPGKPYHTVLIVLAVRLFQVWEHDTSRFVLLSHSYFCYLGSFAVPY